MPFFLAHDNLTELKAWLLGGMKNEVEWDLHVARIQNRRPNSRTSCTAGSVTIIVILIQKCSRWKTSFTRKDKNDQFSSGYGDLKGLTRFSQSLFFSFSIKEKTKGGSAHRLLEKLRTTQWKFRGKPNKESKIHDVAIEHLLLLNMKLMAENARRRKEWRLSFKRFRLCEMWRNK